MAIHKRRSTDFEDQTTEACLSEEDRNECMLNTAITLAKHDIKINQIENVYEQLKDDIKDIKDILKNIGESLAESKGGWRVGLWIVGATGIVGSVLGWLSGHIK